jgi:hypothetical protein
MALERVRREVRREMRREIAGICSALHISRAVCRAAATLHKRGCLLSLSAAGVPCQLRRKGNQAKTQFIVFNMYMGT